MEIKLNDLLNIHTHTCLPPRSQMVLKGERSKAVTTSLPQMFQMEFINCMNFTISSSDLHTHTDGHTHKSILSFYLGLLKQNFLLSFSVDCQRQTHTSGASPHLQSCSPWRHIVCIKEAMQQKRRACGDGCCSEESPPHHAALWPAIGGYTHTHTRASILVSVRYELSLSGQSSDAWHGDL